MILRSVYDLGMTDEPTALAAAIATLQTELNRADREAAARLGVGGAEDIQVLRLLLDEGPTRVSGLARRRGASAATVSARLDRLERRGLVRRERLPDDRRAVVATLTSSGRDAATTSRAERHDRLRGVADGFPLADLECLITALQHPAAASSSVGLGD